MADVGILEFRPVLKRIRWGGRRLGDILGKMIGDETDYAESWEVSCHANGLSVVDAGPHQNRTLKELIAEFPDAILGPNRRSDEFPLLIKFLDASDRLSVQVHPNDEHAQRFQPGANGKTEFWVILDAKPGSRIYAGLKAGVHADRLRAALASDTVADCLHSDEVSRGDCVFIPAGTVHAIGEGILLAEIQQCSDITFRLDDWGRVGTDGQPRELHIEEALSCIDFERGPVERLVPRVVSAGGLQSELLVESQYFTTRRYTASGGFTLPAIPSFRVLMTLDGAGSIRIAGDTCELTKGKCVLIPAECDDVSVHPLNTVTLLEAVTP